MAAFASSWNFNLRRAARNGWHAVNQQLRRASPKGFDLLVNLSRIIKLTLLVTVRRSCWVNRTLSRSFLAQIVNLAGFKGFVDGKFCLLRFAALSILAKELFVQINQTGEIIFLAHQRSKKILGRGRLWKKAFLGFFCCLSFLVKMDFLIRNMEVCKRLCLGIAVSLWRWWRNSRGGGVSFESDELLFLVHVLKHLSEESLFF